MNIKLDERFLVQYKQNLQNKLEVAAIKAWEAAVERAPAAGETPYSTGQMRQSIRVQKTGEWEYSLLCPQSYGVFVEYGTGPRGKATGAIEEYPNDPYSSINYHEGEVLVTRHRGRILDQPYIRRTLGMEAQPFMRTAILEGKKWLDKLLTE